jgi:hypothetical protein
VLRGSCLQGDILRAIAQRENERKGDFAFLQIAQDGLAEFFGGGGEIEEVVNELEGEAGLMAVFGEGAADRIVAICEDGAKFGATAKKAGGFAIGKVGGFRLGEINAIEMGELEKLAFHHVLREVDENIENGEVAFLQSDFEGLHVEPIAGEDAHVIAPAGVGRGAATARVGAIDNVVMDERGAVNHFDDSAERNGGGALISAGASSKQKKRRTEAFAATFAEIAANFGDRLDGFAGLGGEFAFDEGKIVANEVKHFANGQDGDGSLHRNNRSLIAVRKHSDRVRDDIKKAPSQFAT